MEQSEDARVELKEMATDQVLRDFPTDIAAVSNGKGGAIVFGVTNAREFVGLDPRVDERERISQEAAKCRPPVQIDFDMVLSEDKKRFLVVHVPAAATLPHSDHRDRVPMRVGNVTAYLDPSGVMKWLSERGLLSREAQQVYPESKREPISDVDASAIADGLDSGIALRRIEALRDMAHLCHRHVVLDRGDIALSIGRILREGTTQEARLILEGLRSVVLWGPEEERNPVLQWFDRVAEIARDVREPELARMAWDVLQCARQLVAADIVAEWVMTDADTYAALAPGNMLQSVRFYGLDHPIRAAMHRLLGGDADDEFKTRASQILEALRIAY